VPFTELEKHRDFFDYLADNYQWVYWVPGNHEYYHSDIAIRSGYIREKIRSNVLLVNNTSAVHNDVALIFSTLWSRIDPADEWQIVRAMSDFHVITYNGNRFSVPVYNQLHSDCLRFIQQQVAGSEATNQVVVTHHIPTFLHYPARFRGDILNQAFAVELHDYIATSSIHSWIYGHHHSNTPDFLIGNTAMLTNQLGYVKHGEHKDFNPGKVFQIG